MVLSAVFALASRRPLGFAMGYGAGKTAAADVLVQSYIEKREVLDVRRTSVFFVFGLVQVGFVQYHIFVTAFSRLFPGAAGFAALPLSAKLADGAGLRNMAKQVT